MTSKSISSQVQKEALLFIGIASVCVMVVMYITRAVVMPFVLGAFVAYVMTPLFLRLCRSMSAVAAALMAVTVFFIVTYVLMLGWLPLVLAELAQFIASVPDQLEQARQIIARWVIYGKQQGVIHDNLFSAQQGLVWLKAIPWNSLWDGGSFLFQSLLTGGMALLNLFGFILITPIIAFMMLQDREAIVAWVHKMIPPRLRQSLGHAATMLDDALATTVRGYGTVILIMSLYYSLIFSLLGVPFALALAFLNGVLILIPYLGFVAGVLVASLAVSFEMNIVMWLLPLCVAGNMVESFYLTPRYVGLASGVHPLLFLFMVFFGGAQAGLVGAIIAAPVAAVLVVFGRMAGEFWRCTDFYVRKKSS